MTTTMNDDNVTSLAQLAELVKLGKSVNFSSKDKKETYQWIGQALGRFRYEGERKKNKTIIKQYIITMTGYSEGMVDKLIRRKREKGVIVPARRTQPTFPRVYNPSDVELLADLHNSYLGQNGAALRKVCHDQFYLYGDVRFERLSHISVSHLYNLKETRQFRSSALLYTKTNPTSVAIGERRKPEPEGRPGSIRVDSVHQGDLGKVKGVYHINLVDEVTQTEVLTAVEKISEGHLVPALEAAILQFPFVVWNFHSDNGSEYINKQVAELLEKLRIKQTKSRSRHTNDQALVEGKNAAVPRKQLGHAHIPQKHAGRIDRFYRAYLNPFLFFHRPCAFPTEIVNEKGKIRKVYKQEDYQTPFQKLCSLDKPEQYLRPGITIKSLREDSVASSHLEFAKKVQIARSKLFKDVKLTTNSPL